jgi:hypothetical protein
MKEDNNIYVICVPFENRHLPSAKLTKCYICSAKIWCMPHNLHNKTICISCAIKLSPKSIQIGIKRKDLQLAKRHLGIE